MKKRGDSGGDESRGKRSRFGGAVEWAPGFLGAVMRGVLDGPMRLARAVDDFMRSVAETSSTGFWWVVHGGIGCPRTWLEKTGVSMWRYGEHSGEHYETRCFACGRRVPVPKDEW